MSNVNVMASIPGCWPGLPHEFVFFSYLDVCVQPCLAQEACMLDCLFARKKLQSTALDAASHPRNPKQPKPNNSTTGAASASTSQTTTTERNPKISFKEGDSSKKEFAPISHSDMGNILYHFSAAIFTNGPERVVREKDFFHWIVLDYLDQPRDLWQMSLFAGLLFLQRYRAINTLRGKNSTSHTLLSAFPLDAVVFSVAMMGLQYCVADKGYKAVGIDKSMDHRRGTHESCKLAMLRGLEWNMHIGAKDLEKFRKDVIGAGLDASVHKIIVNQPLGFYGGPSRETLVLDGRMWSIVHDLDEANVHGDGAEPRDQAPQGIKDLFSTLIRRAVGYN